MSRTLTIVLDGQEIEIPRLKTKAASRWRQRFAEELQALMPAITAAIDAPNMDLSDVDGLKDLAAALLPVLGGAMDQVLELLIAYAPEQREVLENAYDEEIIAAFVEVFKIAFPFGLLKGLSIPGQR